MDEEKELEEDGEIKLDEDLDLPPEGMGEDFGLEDPDDHYH
jgi:hypothetical protein